MAPKQWVLVAVMVLHAFQWAESKNVWGTRNNRKKSKEEQKKSAFEILQERHLQADDATEILLDSMKNSGGEVTGIDLLINFLDKGSEFVEKPEFFDIMLNINTQVKQILPQLKENLSGVKNIFGSSEEDAGTVLSQMWNHDVSEMISKMKTILKDLRALAEELVKAKGSKRRLRSVLEKFPQEAREYVQLLIELDIESVRQLIMSVLDTLDPMEQLIFTKILSGDFEGAQKMMRQYLKDDERLERLRQTLAGFAEGSISEDNVLLDKAKFKQFVMEAMIESGPTPRQDDSM
jgi:hypothetical protein